MSLDKEIISHFEENELSEVRKILNSLEKEQLTSMLEKRLSRGRSNTLTLIKAILQASGSDESEQRFLVYRVSVNALQSKELPTKFASEIISYLMLKVDDLLAENMAELCELYSDAIKVELASNGKVLELLPKILSSLKYQEKVCYNGNQMSGADYRNFVINSVSAGKWCAKNIVHLTTMFRELELNFEQLDFIVNKLLRLLKTLDPEEMPSLIYQILHLIGTDTQKKLTLESIANLFTEIKDKTTAENDFDELSEETAPTDCSANQVEGTVILHITYTIKEDHDIGRAFIKYMKSQQSGSTSVFTPFNVALALSIALDHSFQSQIYDLLKSSALKSYKDRQRTGESAWITEVMPQQFDLFQTFKHVISKSSRGWNQVIQGLVEFGFVLINSFGPKATFGRVTETGVQSTLTPTQETCQLGSQLLFETFKAHEMVRSEVIQQLLNNIVTKTSSPVSVYLDLMSQIIRSHPSSIVDSVHKIRESLDSLIYLPFLTARGFLRAILPVMKVNTALKDTLILILRKASFSKQLESRKIAVDGFLIILRNFAIQEAVTSSLSQSISLSQISIDVHTAQSSTSNEATCLEIVGNLRRSLTQQADIRIIIYEGLFEVISRNPPIRNAVLSLLLSQILIYYESTRETIPPLKLELCVAMQGTDVYLKEPLGHLLGCIGQCCSVTESEDILKMDDNEKAMNKKIEKIFLSLTERMIKSDLDDFELDKNSDFSMENSVGIKNHIYAILLFEIYEVLLEYNFVTSDYDITNFQLMIQLSNRYKKLLDVMNNKGSKRASANKSLPKSLLSFQTVSMILESLFVDKIAAHQEALELLRQDFDFTKFVLKIAFQKINLLETKGVLEDRDGSKPHRLYNHCSVIARSIYHKYIEESEILNVTSKEQEISELALDIFVSSVGLVVTRYREKIETFLSSLDPKKKFPCNSNETFTQAVITDYIKEFQQFFVSCMMNGSDEIRQKQALAFFTIITSLAQLLPADSEKIGSLVLWMKELATQECNYGVLLAKSFVREYLRLVKRQKSCCSLIRDISKTTHFHLGDIDKDVVVENHKNLLIVNRRNSTSSVLPVLFSQIERELEDTEWVIGRMKSDLTAKTDDNNGQDEEAAMEKQNNIEKSVCTRLGIMVQTFYELTQSCITDSATVELLLKNTSRLYTALATLVKFYLATYTLKVGRLGPRFEKLVKVSCADLTQYVYSMITFMQTNQAEALQKKGNKSAKKGERKTKNVQKARALKEGVSIPNLIYSIEQYEKYLIQLSKKSKTNFNNYMKLSTSRDFRIRVDALQQRSSSSSSDEDESEQNKENEDSKSSEPPGKRKKH